MFRLNRNERSHWSGNGVHVESELVFMIGRNMHTDNHKTSSYPHINAPSGVPAPKWDFVYSPNVPMTSSPLQRS